MYPLLIKIGPIPVHTYGLMIAIGFLMAIYVIRRLAAASKLDVERTIDLTFWLLLVGFVGSRLLFILTRINYFISDPAAVFKLWEGGLVFFGGPLAAVPYAVWYFRKHRLPLWKTLDVLVPGLVIAHGFGRVGCLAAGCCYGKPTGSSFGIRFYSDLVEKNLHGIPLYPTQLYEATALFILFGSLIFLQKRKSFDGQVTLTYFMAYPIIRSIIEIFRGDLIRGFVIEGVLSTSQFISLLVFAVAGVALIFRLKQVHQNHSEVKAVGGGKI